MRSNLSTDIVSVGVVVFLFGREENSFYVLIFLYLVNVILGIIKALKERAFKLTALRDSVLKFMAVILILISFSVVAKLDGTYMERLNEINPYLLWFFIGYYLISIVDNGIAVGVPFPKKALEYIKNKIELFDK